MRLMYRDIYKRLRTLSVLEEAMSVHFIRQTRLLFGQDSEPEPFEVNMISQFTKLVQHAQLRNHPLAIKSRLILIKIFTDTSILIARDLTHRASNQSMELSKLKKYKSFLTLSAKDRLYIEKIVTRVSGMKSPSKVDLTIFQQHCESNPTQESLNEDRIIPIANEDVRTYVGSIMDGTNRTRLDASFKQMYYCLFLVDPTDWMVNLARKEVVRKHFLMC